MSLHVSRRILSRATIRPARDPRTRPIFTRGAAQNPSSLAKAGLAAAAFLTGTTVFLVYYLDSRSAIHKYVIAPVLRATLDAETSHKAAVKVLRTGWAPKDRGVDDERLATELWGEKLPNPVGLAAGFDKDGEAIDGLFDLGFGWVEIGSVTPKPQPGNPQPRVFRLAAEEALINRYGFPSQGHASLISRLRARSSDAAATTSSRDGADAPQLLSINLGKNKSSPPNSADDFLAGIRKFAPYAPVLVINVSSPNTPGLCALQGRDMLQDLLARATRQRDAVEKTSGRRAALVLKIAPDLTEDAVRELAEVVRESAVDGVIVSNTTVSRPDELTSPQKEEKGGLSGRPLKSITLHTLSLLRSHLPASMAVIGCGGISSGADALEYARAGANAVQIYTALGYGGAGIVRCIKDEITEELRRLGTSWSEVSRDAIDRLAWTPPPPPTNNADVASLIREAEKLHGMLDDLAERIGRGSEAAPRFSPNGAEEPSGEIGAGVLQSEEEIHTAVPPPVSLLPATSP